MYVIRKGATENKSREIFIKNLFKIVNGFSTILWAANILILYFINIIIVVSPGKVQI